MRGGFEPLHAYSLVQLEAERPRVPMCRCIPIHHLARHAASRVALAAREPLAAIEVPMQVTALQQPGGRAVGVTRHRAVEGEVIVRFLGATGGADDVVALALAAELVPAPTEGSNSGP